VVAVVVLLALGAGAVALWRTDPWGERGSGLTERFDLDVAGHIQIDPKLIRYALIATIDTSLPQLRGLAVGPDDHVFVAGNTAVHQFDVEGRLQQEISVADLPTPTCLAVGGENHAWPGRLYVGTKSRVYVFDRLGKPLGPWPELGEKGHLTSIAAADRDVYIADAGNRVVYRYDADGKLVGRIGQPDPDRAMPGFVIPSPYFDVAVGGDSPVYVANTGVRRIEAYTAQGELETFWGQSGSGLGDFFGCCNPAHFALLPDGRFVTSEKGIPRVKVYSVEGEFQCVVAGPRQLGSSESAVGDARGGKPPDGFDVATDSQGRVLVLAATAKKVLIFSDQGVTP
jgi:DNA-binding beta-propeller fold protein YncE